MFKTILKWVFFVFALLLIGIQFIDPGYRFPVSKPGESLTDVENVPEKVRKVLKKSCADCHSNETVYPWYSRIAPLSWGMADHIMLGREELNFSEWKSYSTKRKIRKLKQMCKEVEAGQMPFYQYIWLHSDAALSLEDKAAICDWSSKAIDQLKTD